MKSLLSQWTLISLIALGFTANWASAAETSAVEASTLLYISPAEYRYSVRLLHPYYDYWYMQGPVVEPIALQALQNKSAEVAMCKANEMANTIIRIRPSLFYNPQSRVFYSKLEATAYSGGGQLIGQYIGEAQQLGLASVDSGTQLYLKQAYALAMQDLMTKLPLAQLAKTAVVTNKLPCGMIGAQQEPSASFY